MYRGKLPLDIIGMKYKYTLRNKIMNLLEYVKQGGRCKSKSGHWFTPSEMPGNGEYPIKGYLTINGKSYYYEWTEDGSPHNLPYTHGLDLMPVIKVTSYRMVDKDILSRYMHLMDFEHDAQYIG
mgnify:CR=1 FL=1